jgi:hypothetical protein
MSLTDTAIKNAKAGAKQVIRRYLVITMTSSKKPKAQSSYSDFKTKLADFDLTGLLGLIQDLYTANRDYQTFLHACLNLGGESV